MSKRSARRKAARQRQAAAQGGPANPSGNGQVSTATPPKAATNKAQGGKAQAGKTQPKSKTRGTWLTVALAFILIDAIIGAVIAVAFMKQDDPNTPLLITAAGLVALLGVAAAVGLWFWKKWALVLYVVTILASVGIGLMVVPSLFMAFHAVIPLLILGAALSVDKKLPLFE